MRTIIASTTVADYDYDADADEDDDNGHYNVCGNDSYDDDGDSYGSVDDVCDGANEHCFGRPDDDDSRNNRDFTIACTIQRQ